MALNAYISALQILLHDQAGLAYPVGVLTGFINEARQQTALEGECIRGVGLCNTVPDQIFYQATDVTPPTTPAGIASLSSPRSIQYDPGFILTSGATPQITLEKRNWEWFNFYVMGLAANPPGPPRVWCPLNQGNASLPQGGVATNVATSNFYVNIPNAAYALLVDGMWTPVDLADNNTPEAIPGPWTDAVPHYALSLAFMDARLNQLAQEAMQNYSLMMVRARSIVTPLREQLAFPGGLAARRSPGEAPPQWGAGAGPSTPPASSGGGG